MFNVQYNRPGRVKANVQRLAWYPNILSARILSYDFAIGFERVVER